jgi:hypothetical protein
MNTVISEYQSTVDSILPTIQAIKNIKAKYGEEWSRECEEHLDLWKNHLHKLSGDTMTKLVEMMAEVMIHRPDIISDKFKNYIQGCAEIIADHLETPKMNVKGTRALDNVLDTDKHSHKGRTHKKWMFVFILELHDLFVQINNDNYYNKIQQQTVFRKLFELKHGNQKD